MSDILEKNSNDEQSVKDEEEEKKSLEIEQLPKLVKFHSSDIMMDPKDILKKDLPNDYGLMGNASQFKRSFTRITHYERVANDKVLTEDVMRNAKKA